MLIITPSVAKQAAETLSKNDPALAPVIKAVGVCTIEPHHDYYRSLVDSIIGQQLSVTAAASIKRKFRTQFNEMFPTPQQILDTPFDTLRNVGLSNAKTKYIQDLAGHVREGKLTFERIDSQSNEDIIRQLTDVKGIGEWTAHMFLMFCVGRTDVLPVGDLGIQNGMQRLYNLPAKPNRAEMAALAEANGWHPYESIAAWYVWQSLELQT